MKCCRIRSLGICQYAYQGISEEIRFRCKTNPKKNFYLKGKENEKKY